MFIRPSRPTLFTKGLAILLACCSLTVQAGKDDFKQDLRVESALQSANGIEKSMFYRGEVTISQGSLLINADEVELIAKDGAGNEIFIARGKPATYEQTMEDGSRTKAIANEIKYTVNNRTLALQGNAEMHLNTSKVQGEAIVFDMQNEKLIAEGDENTGSRVITIFRPESFNDSQEEENDNP